jgi:hypothetical protein
MQHPYRLLAALLLGAAAGCDSPTRDDRELPPLASGAAVQGTVEAAAADTFALVPPEGEFRVLLRATSGSAADSLVATVITATGNVVGMATSVGVDADITAQSTGWLAPAAGGEWRVVVRGHGADDAGAYALQLFTRSAAPERAPTTLTIGATVDGEALDVPGDVDEFRLDGAAGDEWILFAQSNAAAATPVRLELVDAASGTLVAGVLAVAPTAALESQSTGRVVLPRTGTYLVRVAADDAVRGPYRFRVDRVHRAPETRGAAVALGDVFAETIGSVGDVDEFTFTSPVAGQEMSLLVQLQQGMSAGLRVQLLRNGTLQRELVVDAPAASLNEQGVSREVLVEPGQYTIRVSGEAQGTQASASGAYRLELYPVDRRPEAAGQVRLDGPAASDAIDRPGDVDVFEVPGTAGQLVVIHVSRPPGSGVLEAAMLSPGGPTPVVQIPAGAENGYSFRVPLPATQTYQLRVSAWDPQRMGTGAYTVRAYTIDPAPEHVPATVAIGQTVTGERIDHPGDLDVFTFTGQAGRTVSLFLGQPDAGPAFVLSVRTAAQSTAYMYTFGGPISMDARSTGRIPLESTGYVVTVDPQAGGSDTRAQSAYAMRLFEIDRRPEGVPAVYVLGDTVKTEPLYPVVDIDDYRFELAASTPVRAWFSGPASDPVHAVWGLLYNEDTGAIVWGGFNNHTSDLTLPAGRYRFSVLNQNLEAPSETAQAILSRLNYRFAIVRR